MTTILPERHRTDATHTSTALGDHTSAQASVFTTPMDWSAERITRPGEAIQVSITMPPSPRPDPDRNGSAAIDLPRPNFQALADPFLALAADVLNDAEENRKANANRLRHLTRTEADEDGAVRGLGLDESHPDVARLAALVDLLGQVEHQATLNLARLMRQHPLGPWIKAQRGVGDKQAARLLAVVLDPCYKADGTPRTISDLWSYCGHGDASRKRRKGMSQAELFAMGNQDAKMRLWNISASCLKAGGHYADVYRARRVVTAEREHAADCFRCGPSGRPALAGSPWSPAHQHADALRIVGKEFLRDLWIEARRIHDLEDES